jgi:hypothetical protein
MWEAMALRAISQYVIEFEESGCYGSVTVDPETWLEEEQRIHGVYISPHCDFQRRVFILRSYSSFCFNIRTIRNSRIIWVSRF